MNNLTGQRFGKLVVKKFSHKNQNRYYWLCVCDCGIQKAIRSDHLGKNDTISCGHTRTHLKNIIGQKFGNLVVISKSVFKNGRSFWKCRCSCGRELIIDGANLKSGNTRSCGHLTYVSKSERSFLNKLEKLINEKIERQFCIYTKLGRRFYDGFIKSSGTLIEVDGKTWHSSASSKRNDIFKNKIARQSGYKLVRYRCDDLQSVDNVLKIVDYRLLK